MRTGLGASTKAVLGYVAIAGIVAGAVVMVGGWRGRSSSPVAVSVGAPLVDASAAPFVEGEPATRKTAPTPVAAVPLPPRTTTEKPSGEMLPWLNPLPPLTALILSTDSPVVRKSAGELDNWLTLTVMSGVKPCFARRPLKPIWAEFSAEFERIDGSSVKISQLRLAKIHGDYVISPEEATCFAESLQAITGHGVSKDAADALAPHLPMDHRFAFEYPCGTCTAK
jgi:hypothetical protein